MQQCEEDLRQISALTARLTYACDVGPDGWIEVQRVAGTLDLPAAAPGEDAGTAGWRRSILDERLIVDGDLPAARGQTASLLSGEATDVQYRVRASASEVRVLRERAVSVVDDRGRATRIVGVIQDITERLAEREAWLNSVEKHRDLVENTMDTLYSATPDGQLTFMGHQFTRYGFDIEKVIRDGVFSVIVPEDHERVAADIQRTVETGAEFPTEFRVRTPEGKIVWLEDHGRLVTDADGTITGLWGVLRDITERKEAEAALRKSEVRFRGMAERSFDAIFELDPRGRISYISPAVERITGRSPADYQGKRFDDWMGPGRQQQAAAAMETLGRGAPLEGYQITLIHTDGSPRTVEVNVAPIVVDGEVKGFHGIIRDMSARLALEDQVRHMQKMEAIGTLAGGVAHDFNNLLTGVLGYSNLLKILSPPDTEVFKAADVIETAAERAAELTRQLLGFARRGKLQNCAVDLHRLVGEVVALLSRATDRRVVMTQRLGAEHPVVLGDPGQLQQVLLNLAVNATDAMPEGGQLTISTAEDRLDEERCRALHGLAPGRYLVLTVRDTGTGMATDLKRRIFEPFFTTKEQGRGTGMGLATAYGIVDSHAGALRVESAPGEGSTFDVFLPQDPDLRAPPRIARCVTRAARRGRVLVVDDEDIVQRVVRGMLEPLGYELFSVRNGREAADYYRGHGDEVDVVLLDLTMPVMDGVECFHALRAMDPDVRAVLSTGHGIEGAAQDLLDEGITGFIQKPYVQADLATALAAAIASPPHRAGPLSRGRTGDDR